MVCTVCNIIISNNWTIYVYAFMDIMYTYSVCIHVGFVAGLWSCLVTNGLRIRIIFGYYNLVFVLTWTHLTRLVLLLKLLFFVILFFLFFFFSVRLLFIILHNMYGTSVRRHIQEEKETCILYAAVIWSSVELFSVCIWMIFSQRQKSKIKIKTLNKTTVCEL